MQVPDTESRWNPAPFLIFLTALLPSPLLLAEETGQATTEPQELVDLRKGYLEAREKNVAPIRERYRQHLEKLQDTFTGKGELDAALQVRQELESLSAEASAAQENTSKGDKEPRELSNLRNIYEDSLAKTLDPIESRYLKHLNLLLQSFTRKRNLDAALALRQEIEALTDVIGERKEQSSPITKPESTPEESLQQWLEERQFTWEGTRADEMVIQFKGNELKVYADGRQIMEKDYEVISESVIQFDWGNGDLNTFTISKNKREFVRFMQASGSTHGGDIKRRSSL